MSRTKKVELLAPAGNPEALYGAVNAGADAIYLAGNRFGARAYADNFSEEQLVEAIKYCHLFGTKIYLTVNTLVKDSEISDLFNYMLPFYEAGLDGVIVQDLGVIEYLREAFPGLELHASTQMSLCTSNGASFLKEQGLCRIVPAREISLEDIKSIKKNVDIEIESFIHGAMCYCYSGQCLFSSILGGRSGNRGRCAQPCRLPYSVNDANGSTKEGHFLSLKDMCTIKEIPELIEAGIDSFKIEGRMKRAEYVAGVVSVYRKYIDLYYQLKEQFHADAKKHFHVSEEDMKLLNSLYIRSQIQNGYYFRHNGKEMITINSPAYTETDELLLNKIHETYLVDHKKLPLSIDAVFMENCPAYVILSCLGKEITVQGDMVTSAQNRPITEENISKQLSKLGGTHFKMESLNITMSDQVFYPLKQINEMRRNAIEQLTELLVKQDTDRNGTAVMPIFANQAKVPRYYGRRSFSVSVETLEQLSALTGMIPENSALIQRIYINSDLFVADKQPKEELLINAIHLFKEKNISVFIMLPYILRETEHDYLKKIENLLQETFLFDGVLVRSVDELGYISQLAEREHFQVRTDANIYTWNQYSEKFLKPFVDGYCIPYELNAAEQHQLLQEAFNFEKIVYSRIPMMITANCITKTSNRCKMEKEAVQKLTDRYGKEFPYITKCIHCYNVIYNSVPLSLYQDISKWESYPITLRLDFTIENHNETAEILKAFLTSSALSLPSHTTGHEKRGVE